jgi:hypothetical protein
MISQLLKIRQEIAHSALFILLLLFIFFIPLFPEKALRYLYLINFSLIFLTSILTLEKGREKVLPLALITFALVWIADILGMVILDLFSKLAMIIFFGAIVVRLLIQVAGSKKVDLIVILSSISGYLLLGCLFAIILTVILIPSPGALNLENAGDHALDELVYFTFVTMTTLGYGDVLPVIPVARSMAIFISISGQFYMAIIVAMLVSKYIATRPE